MKIRFHPLRIARAALILLLMILLVWSIVEHRSVIAADTQREPVQYVAIPKETPEQPTQQTGPDPVIVTAVVTAYAPADNRSGICADSDPSVTSTGKPPGPEYCAADPARLPYGTRLEIPGYGEVEVQDTGGALRSDKYNIRIDVWFPDYESAMAWGRQELEVVIL